MDMTDNHHCAPDPVLPALVTSLALTFQQAGEEFYLVGGAVRDRCLGRLDYDLDFATSALPARTAEILKDAGIETIYSVGEKFGTIGARC